jgi:hypothetical protein
MCRYIDITLIVSSLLALMSELQAAARIRLPELLLRSP